MSRYVFPHVFCFLSSLAQTSLGEKKKREESYSRLIYQTTSDDSVPVESGSLQITLFLFQNSSELENRDLLCFKLFPLNLNFFNRTLTFWLSLNGKICAFKRDVNESIACMN
jgi:hypothetical protein